MSLRAACVLLPLLLCQGCLTRELWREHTYFARDDERPRGDALEHGFLREQITPRGLIVRADANLREAFPEQIGDRAHVLLQPTEHASTFEELSFLARSIPAQLRIVAGDPEAPPDLEVHCRLPVSTKRFRYLTDAPGATHRFPMFASTFVISIPLEVADATNPAAFEPGDRFGRLHVANGRYVLAEESTLDHILWTPVTLLFDAVLSPFELLTIAHWW